MRLNIVPREGGNTFTGTIFGSFASENLASNNLSDDLRARGLSQANSIKSNGDVNPGFGGPLKRDKLWFYAAGRYMFYKNYAGGMFEDKTRNDPNVWTFNPDSSLPAVNAQDIEDGQVRLTWQVNDKHKIAGGYSNVRNCKCFWNLSPTVAESQRTLWHLHHISANWTAPLTNRLLLEAAMLWNPVEHQQQGFQPDLNPQNISVTEQSNNLVFKAPAPSAATNAGNFTDGQTHKTYTRAALSYVTGAHALKVGFSNGSGFKDSYNYALNNQLPYSYRFNNNVPNRVNLFAKPYHDYFNLDADLNIYAQDTWTIDQLTLNGGFSSLLQEQLRRESLSPTALLPSGTSSFPRPLSWVGRTSRQESGPRTTCLETERLPSRRA